jgi:hypothetical protein
MVQCTSIRIDRINFKQFTFALLQREPDRAGGSLGSENMHPISSTFAAETPYSQR